MATRERRARARPGESGALQAYLQAIALIPRLSADAERALAERIQRERDEDALRRLVEANLRFVVSYAKRYRGLGVPFLDLIHEGNLGLMEAARRFDPGRNVKFITYAVWWVRQAILQALSDQSRAFSLPAKLSGVAARFGREVAQLSEALDRTPTAAEIAGDLKISEAEVGVLSRISGRDVSLSDRLGGAWGDEADGPELGETLEQASVPAVEAQLMREALAEQIAAALAELDDREREVLRLRHGLDGGGEARTLQDVGDRLGLTRERIRQIEARAKDKMRRTQKGRELRSYLN
jgi:RNA polymerase primary sigma factor